jgi:pimeloyl-ACP methyl ester carboxylesterase
MGKCLKNGGACDRVQEIRKSSNPRERFRGAMAEITVRGTRIHYLEMAAKRPAKDWPMVFIHGSGGNAGLWQKLMEEMAGEYSSIAIDLPGHGDSPGEPLKSVAESADFVKDFLVARGLKNVVLGGHSFGGAVVQSMALRHAGYLKALLLIGTGARLRVLPEALEMMRQMAFGEAPPKFHPWGFAEKASPEVIAEGEREWAKTGSLARYYDFVGCDQFDIIAEVGGIRLPALIACGQEDRLTPVKYSQFLNQKIAGSKMEVIEGAGHLVMLEKPQALGQAILHFLRSL